VQLALSGLPDRSQIADRVFCDAAVISTMIKDITPLIITYNEEANIKRTLDRLTWARFPAGGSCWQDIASHRCNLSR
jgi:hypothetical protein